tara:strand:- start:173 stop:814 length:642 start_codon:yes stop_codon:yes gene_type:complete
MSIKHTKGVLDLTFADIGTEEALTNALVTGVAQQISSPSKKAVFDATDVSNRETNATATENPESPKKREPEVVKAVRLSNNQLENMDFLNGPFLTALDTSNVLWLDLSFNKFVNISEAMATNFPNLTTIYLHANNISRLSQLKKLKLFPNLKSLSLYGNPVEEHKHYRNYVLNMCPLVTQFDSSPVTGSERKRAAVWAQTFRRILNKEDEDDY